MNGSRSSKRCFATHQFSCAWVTPSLGRTLLLACVFTFACWSSCLKASAAIAFPPILIDPTIINPFILDPVIIDPIIKLPTNTLPTISSIGPQRVVADSTMGPVSFTVNDRETPDDLTLTGTSSNTALVANQNIFLSGTGANRTIMLISCGGGTSDITVTVTDPGGKSASTTFTVTFDLIVLGDLQQTYDGNPKSVSVKAAPKGPEVNITYDGKPNLPVDAGSYRVVATLSDWNCNVAVTATLVIDKATLEILADFDNKTYGQTRSYGSGSTAFSTVGLVGGEKVGSVTITAPNGGTGANADVGSYVLQPSAATGGTFNPNNYSISYKDGFLKVDSLPVVVTGSRPFDGTAIANAAILTVVNAVGSDVLQLSGTATLAGPNNGIQPISSFSGLSLGSPNGRHANYTFSAASGSVSIAGGVAIVTLGNLLQTYDGTPRPASATTVPPGLNVTLTYDGSASAPSNAKSYTVVGTVNDANYTGQATNTLTIKPGVATVTLGNLSQTYDGAPKSASATTVPPGLNVTFTYDGNAALPVNVKNYAVVGTVNDANYTGQKADTFTIKPGVATVTLGNLSHTYDGAPKSASATTVPPGLNVTFTYDGNAALPVNVKSYAVVGTVNDANYTGQKADTFTIKPGAATVTLGNLSHTYDGAPKSASATTVPPGLNVTFTYDGNAALPVNVKNYAVVGTVNDANYTGQKADTFTIKPGAATVTLGNLSQTYDGAPKSASATTVPPGLNVTFTYDGNAALPVNVKNYAVVGTVNDANYTGQKADTFTIKRGVATVTLGNLSHTYDGAPKSASATTVPPGLNVTFTYDGNAALPVNVKNYAVVGTVNDANYAGQKSDTFTIKPGAATVTLGNLSQTYDGAPKAASATTVPPGLNVTLTYDGSASAPSNAKSYTVVGTVNDANYAGQKSDTFTIKPGAATVTLGNLSQTYDGAPKAASATTVPPGLNVTLTYDGSATAPSNAKSYTVVGTVNDANYAGQKSDTFTIKPGAATVTLGNLSQTYDGAPKAASATTVPPGLNVTLTYDGSASAPSNAKSYTVVGTVNDANYAGQKSDTFTIKPGAATVTLGNLSQTYDGAPKAASATTVPPGLNVTLTYDGSASAPSNAKSYTVVGTVNDANYAGQKSDTFTIKPGAATVTLGSLSHIYDGTPKPAIAATTPPGLTVTLTYDGGANPPSNASSYTVVGTVNNPNYTGQSTAKLVIGKAAATVTLGNLSHIYDATPKPAIASTTPPGLTVTLSYDGGANPPSNANSYTVVGTVNDPNYTGQSTAKLVIGKAAATVTLGSLSHIYDGTPKPAIAATTPPGLTVTLTYDGGATPPSNASSYTVVGTVNDPNYTGQSTAKLVIGKAAATVTLGSLSHIYDGTPKPAIAATTPPGLTVTLTYDGGANPPVKVGSYPVTAIVNDTNYAGQTSGNLIITSPSTTITLSNLSHTYDGTPKAVSVATAPPGLNVTIIYNGNATAPVNAGSYQVVATVNDLNYSGQAIDTMVISKAAATVALSNLSQTENGTPRSVSASTSPGGLNVALTYDGADSPPITVGDYKVVATIADANYTGQTTGTLMIRSGNQPPTISVIPKQQTHENTVAGPIPFAISDDRTDAANLTLSVVSSDTALIPADRISIGGSDAQRSLTILPGEDKSGTAQITVRVTDADGASNETSFNLFVRLPSLSIADVVVIERDDGDADACILVTLSAPSKREVRVSFSTADDTAKNGADYREAFPTTLVFHPQSGIVSADPSVSAMLVTSPEITRAGNNVLVTWPRLLDRAVLQQRPDLDCSSDWEEVQEQPVQTASDFRVIHDGAAAQRFYRILPDANFSPAEVSKRITVKIPGDRIFELDKRFFVDLFDPINAEIEKGRGICTIVDQDLPPLSFRRVGDKWLFSWPSIADKYVLLSRPALDPGSDWTQVSATPVVVGDEFQVEDDNAPEKFYRLALRHP